MFYFKQSNMQPFTACLHIVCLMTRCSFETAHTGSSLISTIFISEDGENVQNWQAREPS